MQYVGCKTHSGGRSYRVLVERLHPVLRNRDIRHPATESGGGSLLDKKVKRVEELEVFTELCWWFGSMGKGVDAVNMQSDYR